MNEEQIHAGEEGMKRAGDRAEAVNPGWIEAALNHVRAFCSVVTEPFLAEELRPFAEGRGLASPPDNRAWGVVVRRAARDGLIYRTGQFAVNQRSGNNSTFRPLWLAGQEQQREAA